MHLVHLDPTVGEGCPFCAEDESLAHLFLLCPRLVGMIELITDWFSTLGEVFSSQLYIFGPKYRFSQNGVVVLLNFVLGAAKLAIWKTRKNSIRGQGSVDVVGMLAARLRVEFCQQLVNNIDLFLSIWGIQRLLCLVTVEEELELCF